MILSIGLGPILESKYYIKDLDPNLGNKAETRIYNLGGPALCHARILSKLGADVFATGFLGGLSGQYIFQKLKDLNIYNDFIRLRDETRKDVIISQENNKEISIIDQGPRITREDLGAFYELYSNIVDNFNIVCGIGPLPTGAPDNIYYDLINIGKNRGKKFILDAKGRELTYGIEASPFMLILNREELEDLTKIKVNFLGEAVRLGQGIIESGVEIVVVDLDGKEKIVLNKEMGYRLECTGLASNELGKDKGYLAAGYSLGLERGYDFETTMKLGQGFRIAYGLEDLSLVDMADIKKIMAEIEIFPIHY